MRFVPLILLLAVIAFGARLGWRLAYPPSEQTSGAAPVSFSQAPVAVSSREKAEAQNQARTLTFNAEMDSIRQDYSEARAAQQFPSLDQVMRDQIKRALLSPAFGENLLAQNALRDSAVRLRVGYVCQPREGLPFPVITNDEIDRPIHAADNPAGMTLQALGLGASENEYGLETSNSSP